MAEFIYIAPIVFGLIIALIEMYFVHADEAGLGWLSHGLHAVPTCLIFTFISMNAHWALSFIPPIANATWALYAVPIVIGLVAAVKVKTAAAIAKGGSVGEKMSHALMIGILIAAAPFIWMYVGHLLPEVLRR